MQVSWNLISLTFLNRVPSLISLLFLSRAWRLSWADNRVGIFCNDVWTQKIQFNPWNHISPEFAILQPYVVQNIVLTMLSFIILRVYNSNFKVINHIVSWMRFSIFHRRRSSRNFIIWIYFMFCSGFHWNFWNLTTHWIFPHVRHWSKYPVFGGLSNW